MWWVASRISDSGRNACRVRSARAYHLSGDSFGPRFRISRQFLDGSSQSMEAGDALSPVGGACTLWIRRGAIHFLSSRLVDAGCDAGVVPALEDGPRSVSVDRAHAFRLLHVFARSQAPGPS